MNKLTISGKKLFIPFALLGFPDEETSFGIIKRFIEGGADMLELGFPFSDPIADGPVLQAANAKAVQAGITTETCLRLLRRIRELTPIPIGLLLYANIVYQQGIECFYQECKGVGVTTLLVADVPLEESAPFCEAAKKAGIGTVFIVSELTTPERLNEIIKRTTGFLYLVSSPGVTGVKKELSHALPGVLRTLRSETSLPLFVGFGISTPEHVRQVCGAGADGAICGSALVQKINANLDDKTRLLDEVGMMVKSMKEATRSKI
ncbi:MAG: tryptophan synthase subunit alpha [Nanoarchaeota archaeon]|nr:tryptophan synthase subunit alpha [Nanoarchaeota archaeon]